MKQNPEQREAMQKGDRQTERKTAATNPLLCGWDLEEGARRDFYSTYELSWERSRMAGGTSDRFPGKASPLA